jgi:hypothetical protein
MGYFLWKLELNLLERERERERERDFNKYIYILILTVALNKFFLRYMVYFDMFFFIKKLKNKSKIL